MLVYAVYNKINGKTYIGQTQKSLEHRWDGHIATANWRADTFFHKAIIKYKPENFEVFPLSQADAKLDLDNLERLFIILLRTRNREFGYNLTMGGEGATGLQFSAEARQKMSIARRSYKQSSETIAKASASRRGQKRSPETIAKLRAAQQNRPPISEETREMMRRAKLGKRRPPRSPEYCRNISLAKMGHTVSEETRRKISATLKAKSLE